MLASSILHICVFLVSFGIIKHLLDPGTGKIKLYSPTSIIFPPAILSGNMMLLGEYIFIFPSPICNKCII